MILVPPDGLADALSQHLDNSLVAVTPPGDGGAAIAAYRPQQDAEVTGGAVVLTSGSTASARAVVLSAAAIRASVAATHHRLGGPHAWASALPVHHVAGFMTVARAVVAETASITVRPDLSDLPSAVGQWALSLVPAQLYRVLHDPVLLSRVAGYTVLLGGQAAPPELLTAARRQLTVITSYGMAETCGGCVYDGVALEGVEVLVRDSRIEIGGPTLFSGYRCDPATTAAVMREGRLLTADRGGWRDGRLVVEGRLDDVVISGGVNVDLSLLQRDCDAAFGLPEAGGVVILAVADERWGERVVALTTGRWSLAEVAELLAVHGPAAVPGELRRMPTLAYTSTGKIDRGGLRRRWEDGGDGERS